MEDICLTQLLDWPDDTLRRALPKAPARLVARIVKAYPRTAGRPFMILLNECLSPRTLAFLQEEIAGGPIPTYPQIRQAEAELLKLMRDEAKEMSATFPMAA